jgi:[protein-PII] uridylyltransferase
MRWADFEWAPSGSENAAPAEFIEAFSRSMPARYGVLFDARAIRRHAAVAYRRQGRPAIVELWRALPDGSAALCVVAEDRPGLLSAIAAALVLHRLDVITALVFSRPTGGANAEAVDLAWVRRASSTDAAAIDADEAHSVGEVLCAILSGAISVEQIASQAPSEPPPNDESVVVNFDSATSGGDLATLVVEAPDRPAMLLTITLELFQHGTQIVRSLVRTADGRAYNRFDLTEFSGAPLAPERKEQVRAAVYAALALVEAKPCGGESDAG